MGLGEGRHEMAVLEERIELEEACRVEILQGDLAKGRAGAEDSWAMRRLLMLGCTKVGVAKFDSEDFGYRHLRLLTQTVGFGEDKLKDFVEDFAG